MNEISSKTELANTTSVPMPKHDRATRIAALMEMRELWRESNPNGFMDGVAYQKMMRAEWEDPEEAWRDARRAEGLTEEEINELPF